MRIGDVEVLTVNEAAERLALSPTTLRHQIANGVFNAMRLGGRYVVTIEEVERYNEERKGKHGFANPAHPLYGKRGGGGRRKKTMTEE